MVRRWLAAAVVVVPWLWLWLLVECFNVEEAPTAVFGGPEGSLFGFSLALHKENREGW